MIRIAKAAGAVGMGVLSLGISGTQAALLEEHVQTLDNGIIHNVIRIQ